MTLEERFKNGGDLNHMLSNAIHEVGQGLMLTSRSSPGWARIKKGYDILQDLRSPLAYPDAKKEIMK